MNKRRDGVFITVEGTDGSGKSTQLTFLEEHFRARGREVTRVIDPGGTDAGEEIRRVLLARRTAETALEPWAEAFLYLASRRLLSGTVIAPALAAGRVVLSDRFSDSTLAYQGFGRGLPLEDLEPLCAVAAGHLVPDLTFWLDLAPAKALARVGTADRMEAEGRAFHEKVRRGYLFLAAREPGRIRRIDAGGDPGETLRLIRRELARAGLG